MNQLFILKSKIKPLFQAGRYFIILLLYFFFILNNSFGQITIATTDFNYLPGRAVDTYTDITGVTQTGVIGGNLSTSIPWATTLNNFTSTSKYVVTDNPIKLDSTRFIDSPGDNLFVYTAVSQVNNFLNYKFSNLEPSKPVTVTIKYQSIVDPSKAINNTCGSTMPTFKLWLNPSITSGAESGTARKQIDAPQLGLGIKTGTVTLTATSTSTGELEISLDGQGTSICNAIGISSIVVQGSVKPKITSEQGIEVCVGEIVNLKTAAILNGGYQWQVNDGSGFKNLDADPVQSHELKNIGNYIFQLRFTPAGGTAIVSDPLTVTAIKCCDDPNGSGAASSRTTIYYDDFGLVNLSGTSFKVWDYDTDPKNPKQVDVPSNGPFRRRLTKEPDLSTYVPSGLILDGNYTVAAYLTGDGPYNGIEGSKVGWANDIKGLTSGTQPIGYDHSGKVEGAVLLINNAPNSKGKAIYTRTFNNLCVTNGKKIFFECYITVFTPEDNGVDVTVTLTGGTSPVSKNFVANKETSPKPNPGTWVRVSAEVELTGNTLTMQIINNSDVYEHGNDLAIDDIKILACAPPSLDLVYNLPSLTKDTTVCLNRALVANPTENMKKYYGNNPSYLYQWSTTPDDFTTWKNIGGPIAGTPGQSTVVPDAKTLPGAALADGAKIYFRVVAGSAATLSSTAASAFNMNDPCRSYSVSPYIVGTISCPACNIPSQVTIASTPAKVGKTISLCEGNSANLSGSGTSGNKVSSTTNAYHYSWFKKVGGSPTYTAITPKPGVSAAFTTAANPVTPTATGETWVLRVADYDPTKGTPSASCYLDDTVQFIVNKKITNNIIELDTTICYGAVPGPLRQKKGVAIAGNLATPGYRWQQGTTLGTYTNITGASAAIYTPTALTATTYFVRWALADKGLCHDTISNVVTITVIPEITTNTITPATQTICSGSVPDVNGAAVAGPPAATYQWQQSESATGTFTDVAGGTTQDLPGTVTLTNTVAATTKSFYFRRIAKVGNCTHTSTVVEVKVSAGMDPGKLSPNQTICEGTVPAPITSLAPATGGTTPPPVYKWQTSPNGNEPWTDVAGATAVDFTPSAQATDSYSIRRYATAGTGTCDNANVAITITVINKPIATILTPVAVTSPNTGDFTFNKDNQVITATPAGTGYTATWALATKGTLDADKTAPNNHVNGMAFEDQSVLTWTVSDVGGKCTPAVATLNLTRKNITTANVKSDSICVSALPYTIVGNVLIPGSGGNPSPETSKWEFLPAISSIPNPTFTDPGNPPAGSPVNIVITDAKIPTNAGKVDLYFKYTVTSNIDPSKPTITSDTAHIIIYEATQPATVGPEINTCATLVPLTGNAVLQPTATGTWTIGSGQGKLENKNSPTSNLTDLTTEGVTNLKWTITNHLCPATEAPLVVNQKGKITDARFSIDGGAYSETEITNKDSLPLCRNELYTFKTIIPAGSLKAGESGAWTNTRITGATGAVNSFSYTPTAEGTSGLQWQISTTIVGCPPSTATASFKIGDVPVLDPITGNDPVCENTTHPYVAHLSKAPGINTLGASSYSWSTKTGTPSATGKATLSGTGNTDQASFTFTSTIITGATTDKATIAVNATNACGTSKDSLKLITIDLIPRDFTGEITGEDTICASALGTGIYEIPAQVNTTKTHWKLAGGYIGDTAALQLNQSIDLTKLTSKAPNVTISINLVNRCGVGVLKEKIVNITPAIPVIANLEGALEVCIPYEYTYTGSTPTPNGSKGATYLFEILRGVDIIKSQGPSETSTFPTAANDLANGDMIRLTLTAGPEGCFSGSGVGKDSLIIDGYEYPNTIIVNSQKDSLCEGPVVTLCVPDQKGNLTYEWFKGTVSLGKSANRCHEIQESTESGEYTVTIDTKVCNEHTSEPKIIKIYDVPTVTLAEELIIDLAPDTALNETNIIATVTGTDPDGVLKDSLTLIEWTPTTYITPSTGNLITKISPPMTGGEFIYTINVETGGGSVHCPSEGTIHVYALPPIVVPNAFSPNSDNKNDKWMIDGIDAYKNAKVRVFNRWGSVVYETSPYNDVTAWDGTVNGAFVPVATYYYLIDLGIGTSRQKQHITGFVVVVR